MALATPDDVLVRPGEHLQGFDARAVTRDRPVVLAIGPHQVCEQFRVAGIGLGSRDVVAVTVTSGGHWIDREDLIVRRDQRSHDQTAVLFDADHHLTCFIVVAQMLSHERV